MVLTLFCPQEQNRTKLKRKIFEHNVSFSPYQRFNLLYWLKTALIDSLSVELKIFT